MAAESNTYYYYGTLVAWIFVIQAVGATTGYFTRGSIRKWYKSIKRSPLTPPNYVFPVVWTTLYIMIAIAGWKLHMAQPSTHLTTIRILFGVQMLLNWSWSPLFFIKHLTGLSFGIILVMVAAVGSIVYLGWNDLNTVSLLLLPYLIWISFASYLNFYIWANNKEGNLKG